ncbi:MAG TPA: UDP-3-O-(3-hydroxymyristoyl)glucosamine N-acyltransferase [Candidatus Rifleibacterium sp.]|nr:UDP-3-O-(3-hydroxymyristoyl)glucosamine N-acyltransferase [Candidatus Rifleibacterium sp.]HPT47800.1 UDP-3-O-(3-hydroxymyristoyl)glucosamine N-acyltransferase [Candidatus Rifleibacterium sp.]
MTERETRSISLKELAAMTGGRVCGDENTRVSNVAPIERAAPGELTFLSGAKNYAAHLESVKSTRASALIAPEDAPDLPLPSLRLKNPYMGLVEALNFFFPPEKPDYHIHPTAFVSEDAEVAADAIVGPHAVIEAGAVVGAGTHISAQAFVGRNCRVGCQTLLHPGVRILAGCEVGSNCIIHANAVIGSDGFGFTLDQGVHVKVPQVGNVVVEDNVEIGACVTIDRATMETTRIGEGSKIDNMVHIAHNVQIGKKCIIVAQVGISGSTILEDYVTLAGQVGTVGHVRVGKGSTVAARGVVTGDVEAGSFVSGFPIKPHSEERRILAALRKLPDLLKKVRDLEKQLEAKE